MAFELGFTTTDYDQGKSILVVDNSSDWSSMNKTVLTVRLTITSLYDKVELTTTSVVKDIVITGTVVFEEGFEYEITGVDLFGANYDETIPNCIFQIAMTLYDAGGEITDTGYDSTSSEVFYYDALDTLDQYVARKAAYIDDINNSEKDMAIWLDFLITGIESNIRKGNTSAIYYIFDTFSAL